MLYPTTLIACRTDLRWCCATAVERHAGPLMVRAYLRSIFDRLLPKGRKNVRATGGAVKPLARSALPLATEGTQECWRGVWGVV